ncbi:MAG: hypothetical protein ACFE89_06270 [Candidatus Hodarchaeota archaeon]
MKSLRQAFVEHADTVRDFIHGFVQVDSGIYDTNQLRAILQEPDTTIKLETEWLQKLLHGLLVLQDYLELVAKWEEHTVGLTKNLGATPNEIEQIQNLLVPASQILPSKDFDQKYLRWVLEDTAQELDRLMAASNQLLHDAREIIHMADAFQGPFFQNAKHIVQNWQEHLRRDLFLPISAILQEIDTSGTPKETLQEFARYLDTIIQAASVMPMLLTSSSAITPYSPQTVRNSEKIITQLIEGIEQLQEFVKLRSQMYSVLLQEQNTLLFAVLPEEMPTEHVLLTVGLNPAQSVDELLPDVLPMDTLPLALQQAEEALTIWQATTEAAIPYLNNALFLNQILQSPAVEKFLLADQQRLNLFREWHPRILDTFDKLRGSLTG